jgi:ribonuclease P protein component
LGKEERLKSRRLIERVFREGRTFSVFPFRVHYLLMPPGEKASVLQAGFSAPSRHFKKAVDRNRIKRLSREAYRVQKQSLREFLEKNGGALALFFVYTGKEIADLETISGKIRVALQKLSKEVGG